MKVLKDQGLTSDDLWSIAQSCAQSDFTQTNSIMRDLGSPKPVLIWNPKVDHFTNPLFRKAMDWWDKTRMDDLFPKPSDVDPITLKELLGKITLYDVINEGEDFKCRLYGSHLVQEPGKDLTGHLLSEIWTPLKPFFLINFRSMMIRKEPLYTIHQPHHSLNLSRWERLILPLGADGNIERLLTVLVSSPQEIETI